MIVQENKNALNIESLASCNGYSLSEGAPLMTFNATLTQVYISPNVSSEVVKATEAQAVTTLKDKPNKELLSLHSDISYSSNEVSILSSCH